MCVITKMLQRQLLHLFASDDWCQFATSPMGIIDLLTIVPQLVTVRTQTAARDDIATWRRQHNVKH